MNELAINCNLDSPQKRDSKIVINIENECDQELLYKYMVGCNGKWSVLKDFTYDKNIEWVPKKDGKYIVMVQAKKKNGNKSFDYVSRTNYIIGDAEEKLINDIVLNKNKFVLGDKIKIYVDTNKVPVMFRYWIKIDNRWQLAKDYSTDNTLIYTVKTENNGEILVECKNTDSKSDFDDFKKVNFFIEPLKKVQIIDFKCLNSSLICNSEIMFQILSEHEENRTILYKFFKINSSGEVNLIQNYSTKRIVSYIEKKEGNYRLLCLAKDMYSNNKFDDRAILNFNVEKYKKIFIENFTTNVNSPQLSDTEIVIKVQAIGGNELLYRYIIEGEYSEDSGYIRFSSYVWKSKCQGEYKISVFVKDKSYDGEYEAYDSMNFVIDDKSSDPVNIDDFTLNKHRNVLKGENIRAVVSASGGVNLKYSFVIKRDGQTVEKREYSKSNWIEFKPLKRGDYEIEARVRDYYSSREYDCHAIKNIDVFDYIPANIDYILYPIREYYMVGDKVSISIITQDTKNIVVKYIMSINEHKIEETGFVSEKNYSFVPKCRGKYSIDIFAKNVKSTFEFDSKKHMSIEIRDAIPVTNTKIFCEKNKFIINEPVTFYVRSEGGKDVLYEFYIMEKGDWILTQSYSKKNNYTFVPFDNDEYKVMVLSKSQYSKDAYEDYDIFTINV